MHIKAFATILALAAAPVVAHADDSANKPKKDVTSDVTKDKKVKLTDAEVQALAHFHHVDQVEIDMGKLAQKKSAKAGIKSYGQMLVKDHTANDKQLISFAKKHMTVIPKETATSDTDQKEIQQDKEAMDKIHGLTGAEFDREFLMMMVAGHEKELGKLETAMGQVNDPDLKKLFDDMKPVLQRHADEARDLEKSNAQASTP